MDKDKKYWYLAICLECEPVLPQPFGVEKERAEWVEAHWGGTGHAILLRQENR